MPTTICLLESAASGLAVSMLFSAKVGFVYFHSTVHHGPLYFFHGSTNPVAEIPRRFVAHSQSAFDLICAHALACFHQKQHCHKPAWQWQVRVVEDRASRHGELVAAFATCKLSARFYPPYIAVAATWAFNAFGPAQPGKNLTAIIVGRARADSVQGASWQNLARRRNGKQVGRLKMCRCGNWFRG